MKRAYGGRETGRETGGKREKEKERWIEEGRDVSFYLTTIKILILK